jgi:hypothetical protein
MQVITQNKAKVAAATISKAVLEHNVACAREGVKMATRATDAKSAIAAAACVVDAVSRIMGIASNNVGIETLQRAAAASSSAEELAEIVYTAKLIAAVTYAAAAEALDAAADAEKAKAVAKAADSSLRRRNGYTRFDCRAASKH